MTHLPPDPDFTPISPNPFIVGNPVRGRTMFFGREAEFELVRNRFQHSTRGGLLVFCGERRSGKTSILFQILDQRLGPAFIPVLIDMQSMAVGSEVEFLARLSEEIRSALGPDAERIPSPTFPAGSNCSAIFLRFVQDLLKVHPHRKLILLFDEYELFENKIDAGLLAEDVLHVLASLMENEPVFLIFTGSQHLEQRRQEYWKILGKSIYKTISYLERSDALNLIQKPVEGRVDYGPDVVEAIYRLSAGQAFYTQAIAQNLVDRLNEHHTRLATPELLGEVVDGIVNNPLPQMIFLWDGLDRDDKLVLALLAEATPDENAHAGVVQVMRHLRQRGYPLKLETARIATTCEKLFKSEMLLRSDRADGHQYAFRMDLWRRWIKRQHSVWQVMREEKIETRGEAWWRKPALRWAGGVLVGAAMIAGIALQRPPHPDGSRDGVGPHPDAAGAAFALDASPDQALIQMDGKRVGLGSFRDTIVADQVHHFRMTAPGYADSAIMVRLAAGASDSRRVALRELFGALRIATQPPGAEVRVDGRPVGKSPIRVPGLSAAKLHRVAASSRGYTEKQQDLAVSPTGETSATLVLDAGAFDVLITTDPSGSTIRVDGVERGESPNHFGLTAGSHKLSAARDGYLPADTTLIVGEGTGTLRLALLRKPAGVLVVQGDRPASIYIDGNLIVEGVQNTRREIAEGVHQVHVVLQDGQAIDKPVPVKSGELATYDYSLDTVTHGRKGP